MKKTIVSLFIIVLLSFSFAIANGEEFSYKLLRDYKGFKYDGSKHEWTYSRSYTHHMNDFNVVLGIYLSGKDNSISNAPMLLVDIKDPENNKHIKQVKSIEFTGDGNTYTYNKLMNKGDWKAAILGFEGYELVKALIDSELLSVKVILEENNKELVFNVSKKKFDTTVGDICNKLISIDIWDYLDDDEIDKAFEYEEKYPLIINSVLIQDELPNKSTTRDNSVSPKRNTMTLTEGKYIVGEAINAGKYKITCISSSADDYKNTMDGLSGLYDTLDKNNSGLYSDYFSALGSMVSAFDEGVLIEVIGDYGNVFDSFHLKKGDSKIIKLEGKVALRISEGTCTLEKQ